MRVRTLLISIALVGALGCTRQNQSDEAPPPQQTAGSSAEPDEPIEETPPQHPLLDAGPLEDASHGSDGSMAMPMLPPNFTLECADEPQGEVTDDPLSVWQAERVAYGAVGRPARLDLRGASYRVQGAGLATVRAPFTLHTGNTGLVSFDDAEVKDVEEHGRLELYGGGTEIGRMPASAGMIEGIALKTVTVDSGVLEGAIDTTDEHIGNTDFYHASGAAWDLALEDVQQAYLYPEGAMTVEDRIEWMPSSALVLRKATSLTFYQAEGGTVEKSMSEPLDLDYEAFGIAGDFSGGSLEVDDEAVPGTPVAVFGRGAELRAGASSVEAVGAFQITQAVNEAGLVLPAAVEVVPEMPEVWVAPSKTRVVHLYYRERSYRGDAVLGEIQIGGNASELLELQTGFPPTLTGEIIDAVIDTGWAAPLAAIAALPTVSIVFVVDVFSCIFGGCADLPPPLEPFPQWMDAGAIGTMEVRVKGNLAPGTYETSLTFVGRNYCPVTVPLTVHIGEEPVVPDAGVSDAGDAGDAGDADLADGG